MARRLDEKGEVIYERGLWTSHPETALKSPAVWQSWAAWNKKYARRSRSYGEHIFFENCPRLANPARLGVWFLDVMSISRGKCVATKNPALRDFLLSGFARSAKPISNDFVVVVGFLPTSPGSR